MKLLIVAGFPGLGKTTLLLEVAQRLGPVSQMMAIIENEIGETGVDGKYLRQEGLQVLAISDGGTLMLRLWPGHWSGDRQLMLWRSQVQAGSG